MSPTASGPLVSPVKSAGNPSSSPGAVERLMTVEGALGTRDESTVTTR